MPPGAVDFEGRDNFRYFGRRVEVRGLNSIIKVKRLNSIIKGWRDEIVLCV